MRAKKPFVMRVRLTGTSWATLALSGALVLSACTGGISGSGTATSGALGVVGFTVGGTVSGLTGQNLMLQNNGSDTLAVKANGSFTFNALLLPGNSYNVVVTGQPASPTQTCAVTNGSGTISSSNVSSISVVCVDKTGTLDTIGGTVTGDLGTGLVLQINGGETVTVSKNGTYQFPTALPAGLPYSVTVLSPPIGPYQNCSIVNASGTTGASNVNDVAVTCVTNNNPTYTVGGNITGLSSAHATAVLQNNGRNNISMSADGPFTFSLPIPSGSFYNVTSSSVTGPVSLTCAFSNANGLVGNANVTDVSIDCVPVSNVTLTPVSVTVAGLVGSGLVLQDNGADNLSITANGTFGFAVALPSGSAYNVTVLTQPTDPSQTCTVLYGSGTVSAGVAITVSVTCTTNDFTLGGTVTGLAGTGLSLYEDEYTAVTITGNGPFVFPLTFASGTEYQVDIGTQPTGPSQTCTLTNATGTVGAANVTNVQVTCTTNTYSIGGTVSGYAPPEVGLQLEDNGGAALAITASGNFTFPAQVASGATYNVTVSSQPVVPAGPAPTCTVANGTGTVGAANVTNVAVTCTVGTGPPKGDWTWQSGSNTDDGDGVYGTQGTAAAGNVPGARYGASSFVDSASNLWLFGGFLWNGSFMNDLWEYSPATGLWTWQAGSQNPMSLGSYGTEGTPAATNEPPSRDYAVTWSVNGSFYLFGGEAYAGDLNDLWYYNPSTGYWTWIAGSSSTNQNGVYESGGSPGARYGATSWTTQSDGSATLWLFGGQGYDDEGDFGLENDLWAYNGEEWFFVVGSETVNSLPSYGVQGQGNVENVPGARSGAVSWVDTSGNLWLFGGNGYDSQGNLGPLNDLWEYNTSTGDWIWWSGSTLEGAAGVYGTQGTAASTNTPGARQQAFTWVDSAGNLWLFGGTAGYADDYNDLWEYSPSTNLWTWMGGSNTTNVVGVYGTEGVPSTTNIPGARDSGITWVDSNGNFWLFGGEGFVSADPLYPAPLNDLWEYAPP